MRKENEISSSTHVLLIPSYNTGDILIDVLQQALATWQPVILVIDGSDDGSVEAVAAFAQSRPELIILRHQQNHGKGQAVLTGIEYAASKGYTHVLTMDADGQHPAEAVRSFMDISKHNPEALILGKPVFDAHAPSLRVQGRKVSNFWANLETLWCGIGDSLFGFRVYPIEELQHIMIQTAYARRFDFDPEVAVRLAWRGLSIINIEIPVRYLTVEEGGISQFRYLRDNTLLTWMHLRLLAGFGWRLPLLITRLAKTLIDKGQ